MKVTKYLHSDKEANYDTAEGLGLSETAQDQFKYCLYEVEFDIEVKENGEYLILEVRDNGQVLRPVNGGLTDGYNKEVDGPDVDGARSDNLHASREHGARLPNNRQLAQSFA